MIWLHIYVWGAVLTGALLTIGHSIRPDILNNIADRYNLSRSVILVEAVIMYTVLWPLPVGYMIWRFSQRRW